QTRREFVAGALAAGAAGAMAGCSSRTAPESRPVDNSPLKFLFMTDHHIESDFIENFGALAGNPRYTMWKPGNHAALVKTYEFINSDPYCRDIRFALFGGDQLNTGYMSHRKYLEDERANYYRTLQSLDLYRNSKGSDISDLDFRSPESFFCKGNLPKGYVQRPIPFLKLDSRVIAIQGNHDTAVEDFYRECSFKCGDTRFITFFARYVGLPAPKGQFRSTARISDEAMDFIEKEMAAAAADPSIRHIVLASHWAIAPKGKDFVCPIVDACKENKLNDNRKRLLALAEKFGCDLYINGHEHNGRYPVGKAGTLSDINCGTVTGDKASWCIVEMHPDKAVFNVYSRAAAVEAPDGKVTYTRLPQRLFTREIPLMPIRHSMAV
ncbi:MAG: metallophosphoesterase, partial [Kiritimatiellae bacterium]|nr:metallophosphoesterase [Kiritimatiellia bacterium]